MNRNKAFEIFKGELYKHGEWKQDLDKLSPEFVNELFNRTKPALSTAEDIRTLAIGYRSLFERAYIIGYDDGREKGRED